MFYRRKLPRREWASLALSLEYSERVESDVDCYIILIEFQFLFDEPD